MASKTYKPLPDSTIKSILENNPKPEAKGCPATQTPAVSMFTRDDNMDYDTLCPESTIKAFVKFLKDVTTRWDGNFAEIGELDKQVSDLVHYIELETEIDKQKAYEFAIKLRDARIKRRKLKDENRLLGGIYNYIKANPNISAQLATQQGYCTQQADAIARQAYLPRTDVLEELGGEDDMTEEPGAGSAKQPC
jgi:hypothetical protein